jgi:superfamily II DNA helicase RecQ
VGIDPPPSVKVYHLGAVWSIVSMFQAAGRSGRGSAGSSTFITSINTLRTFFRNNDVSEAIAQQIEG